METLHTVILYLLVRTIYTEPTDECPHNLGKSDLYTYGDICIKVHYGNFDWDDARHQCQIEGGDLIQIRDAGMQQFLQRILSGQRSEDSGFWIGASDRESESHWKWVSVKDLIEGDPAMTYSHWSHGQGPEQHGFFFSDGGNEDCALMKIDDGFKWHDYECSLIFYHYSFICQYDKMYRHTKKTTSETPATSTQIVTVQQTTDGWKATTDSTQTDLIQYETTTEETVGPIIG